MRAIKQRAQVVFVVGTLHYGIIDARAGNVDPANNVPIDLLKLVEINVGDVVALLSETLAYCARPS